jgi:hypothetical protein
MNKKQPLFTNIQNVYIDTYDNRNLVYLYKDGTFKISDPNKTYNGVFPPGVTGFKSMTMNNGYIVAVGTNSNLYVCSKQFWSTPTASNWAKSTTIANVSKVLTSMKGSYNIFCLTNDGTLYYGPDGL